LTVSESKELQVKRKKSNGSEIVLNETIKDSKEENIIEKPKKTK